MNLEFPLILSYVTAKFWHLAPVEGTRDPLAWISHAFPASNFHRRVRYCSPKVFGIPFLATQLRSNVVIAKV